MAEYNVQLRGWHALVAIVALIGFTGFKMYLRVRPVEDSVRDAIRLSLLNEYSGRGPKDVARLVGEARAVSSPVAIFFPPFSRVFVGQVCSYCIRWTALGK